MPLRAALESDLDDIISLIKALALYEKEPDKVVLEREVVRQHLFGPNSAAKVVLAETDEGAVVGFALYFVTFSADFGRPGVWLEDLFVLPEHRKRGFGKALIADVRRSTAGQVEWAVLDWNEPSIQFYSALGARMATTRSLFRWEPRPAFAAANPAPVSFPGLKVHAAVEADVDAVVSVIRAAEPSGASVVVLTPEVVRAHLLGPHSAGQLLLAKTDAGEVVGVALSFRTFSTWLGRTGVFLERLFILPEHRDRGCEQVLLDGLMRSTDGRLECSISKEDTRSIQVYESVGAKRLAGWETFRWAPRSESEAVE